MEEKERGAVSPSAPGVKASKLIVASERVGVNKIPGWLPKVKLPRNDEECDDRVKCTQIEMGRKIDFYAYEMGVLCRWKKLRLGHGQFVPWAKKNCWQSIRTLQNFMEYSIKAEMSPKYIGYNPNKKRATVALLDSPAPDRKDPRKLPPSPKEEVDDWPPEKKVAVIIHEIGKITRHSDADELAAFENALTPALRDYFEDVREELERGAEES